MALYDLTDKTLQPVAATTFAAQRVWERTHLQAALRDNIDVISDDLLVVAEEFGDFLDAKRRIDLLCVDREAHLVVIELKRTEDGGHMELQALRYAAMVSAMTFDDLVNVYGRHLSALGSSAEGDPRDRLLDWLEAVDEHEPVIEREVRVVLLSSGFDKQITTTALYLNEVFGLDIRCVRLTPYRVDGRLLLDIQTVVPLPEAEEYLVRLKRRESAARAAMSSTKDFTRFVITSGSGTSEPLPKRRAVLEMATAVVNAGTPAAKLSSIFRPAQWLRLHGHLYGDGLAAAFKAQFPTGTLSRYFHESPIHDDGDTWLLSNQWGQRTEATLTALAAIAPDSNVSFAQA